MGREERKELELIVDYCVDFFDMCVTGGIDLTEWNFNEKGVLGGTSSTGNKFFFFLCGVLYTARLLSRQENCLLLIEDDPFRVLIPRSPE